MYDAGCFDWDVECIAEAPQEIDFEHYWDMFNIGSEDYVDEHFRAENPSKSDLSRDIQVGQEVLNDIKNGNVPIVLVENLDKNSDENSDEKAWKLISAGSTATGAYDVFAQQLVEHIEEFAKDVNNVAKVGKAFGQAGALVGLLVSAHDLSHDGITKSEVIGAVGSVVGAVGAFVPIGGWVLGGISLSLTIYAAYLDRQSSSSTTNY